MADFIPTSNNSIGQILGSSLGKGLAAEHWSTKDVLQQLAQNKALNVAAQHYRALNPGVTEEQAQALVRQPANVQQAAFGYQPQAPQQQQPQMQQQMPQQQQQMQQPNLMQLLQNQPQRQPSFAELEFLRRLPPAAKAKMGPQLPPEQMTQPQMPNAQPNQQMAPPNVGQEPQQQAPSLGEFIGGKLAKPGSKSQQQQSKEDQQFGLDLSKRIDYAPKILKALDDIDTLTNKPDIQWGLIASKVPRSQLNTNTKKLVNKFAQVLAQQVQSASQGRGSDLLRNIIKEGKFTLEDGPEVWREVSSGLRGDVDYDERLYKARHNILKEYGGKPPAELAYLTRERVADQVRNESINQASVQENPKGSNIEELPKPGSPEAQSLEGRALEGPHGPIIYLGGKPYPAIKKGGKWVRR